MISGGTLGYAALWFVNDGNTRELAANRNPGGSLSIARLGDVNGDKHDDLLVGLAGPDPLKGSPLVVNEWFLASDGTDKLQKLTKTPPFDKMPGAIALPVKGTKGTSVLMLAAGIPTQRPTDPKGAPLWTYNPKTSRFVETEDGRDAVNAAFDWLAADRTKSDEELRIVSSADACASGLRDCAADARARAFVSLRDRLLAIGVSDLWAPQTAHAVTGTKDCGTGL